MSWLRATTLDELLQQFLRERKYLHNVSPATIEWYETSWKAFRKSATHCLTDPASLSRTDLEQFFDNLRDRGVGRVTGNTWPRALNAFFRWLPERGLPATSLFGRWPSAARVTIGLEHLSRRLDR
jgi:site-specific recombinase XerD